MRVLITGVAGFIGFHAARRLLELGHEVTGVDNLNAYYSIKLKQDRLDSLGKDIAFHRLDICDTEPLRALVKDYRPEAVLHLAAQAGVRHSLNQPFDYSASNLTGHLSVLEAIRHGSTQPHIVYASSSSVYGLSDEIPFSEENPAILPASLYAATKRANELMSHSYAHLYGIPQIGLRFFTVYGSWGRPDMAYWLFSKAILKGEPIQIFNEGRMARDMTHISDVVDGIANAVTRRPDFAESALPHRVYNVGNSRPERLLNMIEAIERLTGIKALRRFEPMQPGDVVETFANISRFQKEYGYSPKTCMEQGLKEFLDWFRLYDNW